MSETIRLADYFYMEAPDKPGEGARALATLRNAGVNLLAFSGFPEGRRAQLDFVPEDAAAFRAAARGARWKLRGPKKVFLIQGDDRVGVMAEVVGRLSGAGINIVSSQGICAGAGKFGGMLWVAPRDVKRAARLLGA
ncbi:MAG: hypothetical protein HY216_11380 [Candidatus Rokubacteria bacterium]|nr:hypothetical protein [Candidatus Rokubacteria bacterium]